MSDPHAQSTSRPGQALATLDMDLDALAARQDELAGERREKLDLFLSHLYSDNTEAAYRGDWRHWSAWCAEQDRSPLPASPQDVLDYLLDFAERLKPSTLERRLITLGKAHKSLELPSPAADARVKRAFRGLIRTYGRRIKRAQPLTAVDMRALLDALDEPEALDPQAASPEELIRSERTALLHARDRALLLVGWFGAFRQAELVALRVEEITPHSEGELELLLPRSKTDQDALGLKKWLTVQREARYCPIAAIARWRALAQIESGELFRGVGRWGHVSAEGLRPQAVTSSIRRAARLAGYEPEPFSGHSLRRGFCVQAALNGASLDEIMAQTHHRDLGTVMRYIEEANARRRNAVRKVAL